MLQDAERRDHAMGRNPLADRRFCRAEAALAEGALGEAADLYEQAIELAPDWTGAWIALGDVRVRLRAPDQASQAYAEALRLDGNDRFGASLRLGALDPAHAPASAPPAYVGALFDDYAHRYDTHLVEALAYTGPASLIATLADLGLHRFATALDLGCGTGLAGIALRPLAGQLIGVDLAANMVFRAKAKAIYDRLVIGDILGFLQNEPDASADLVLAADVFVYIGDLAPIVTEAARVLRPGGALAFTAQRWDGAPSSQADWGQADLGQAYHVGADLRFAHAPAALIAILEGAGFGPVHREDRATRREKGVDVPGVIMVARKAA